MLNPVSVAVSFLPGFTHHSFLHVAVKRFVDTDMHLPAMFFRINRET
jgi:hypothetical protein